MMKPIIFNLQTGLAIGPAGKSVRLLSGFIFSLVCSLLPVSPLLAQDNITNIFPIFIFDNEPIPHALEWSDPVFEDYRYRISDNTTNTELSDEEDPVDFVPTAHVDEIDNILGIITNIEEAEGPYSLSLEEAFLELGNLYQKDNLTDSAIATFEKSFHVNRINLGLYNEKQIEILESLSEANLRNYNIQAAEENQRYLMFLKTRLESENLQEQLAAKIDYNNWLMSLVIYSFQYNVEIEYKYQYYIFLLQQADEEFTDILETIPDTTPELASLKRELYMTSALCNYYLALFTEKLLGRPMTFRNKEITNPEVIGEKPRRQIFDSYITGKQALEARLENIQQNFQNSIIVQVEATLDLADWYEAFENHFDAIDTYTAAYNLLSESDLPNKDELLNQYFEPEIPVLIPEFVPRSRTHDGLKLDEQTPLAIIGYMDIHFQIDKYGRPSRVSLLETNVELNQEYYFRNLRNNITSSKTYRPYLEEPGERLGRESTLRFYIYGVGDYPNQYVAAVHDAD